MVDYYPWKILTLVTWLKSHAPTQRELQKLAKDLEIPEHILNDWLRVSSPLAWSTITRRQIQLIARYRGWSFDKTQEWLGISSEHLAELSKIR
ncbi:MAG: hypothetical protein ACFBSF_17110 [Leptolyngbyaceae cyanobacterium]